MLLADVLLLVYLGKLDKRTKRTQRDDFLNLFGAFLPAYLSLSRLSPQPSLEICYM